MTFLEMVGVFARLRLAKRVGLSIDITDRCVLSCSGCYMKWYTPCEDLPTERWEEIILSFPARERRFCAWTGGEPLLRAEDIRALSRHFGWNWIATSGTLPIPDIPRTTVFVSVDGPREIHDSVRGGWSDLVRNVTSRCYIACTLRRENSSREALDELVGFWRTRARGMVFGFMTPRAGSESEGDCLGREEREEALAALRALRRRYGSFVLGASGQLVDCARTSWDGSCPAGRSLAALDARGRKKEPCTLGSEVACSRCGCAVPGFLRRVRRLHVPTLVEVSGLFREARGARVEGRRRRRSIDMTSITGLEGGTACR